MAAGRTTAGRAAGRRAAGTAAGRRAAAPSLGAGTAAQLWPPFPSSAAGTADQPVGRPVPKMALVERYDAVKFGIFQRNLSNFRGLVLFCIEADFCNQILTF